MTFQRLRCVCLAVGTHGSQRMPLRQADRSRRHGLPADECEALPPCDLSDSLLKILKMPVGLL